MSPGAVPVSGGSGGRGRRRQTVDDGKDQRGFAAAQAASEQRETHLGTGEPAQLVPQAEVSQQDVGYQRRIGPAHDPANPAA